MNQIIILYYVSTNEILNSQTRSDKLINAENFYDIAGRLQFPFCSWTQVPNFFFLPILT